MNKKKNLLNLFTQDVTYNYHLVKTEEPEGHLIYLIKDGSSLDTDTLEFSPTLIAEELINECSVKIEKFAPSIFFTEEINTEKLKYELGEKLSQDTDFSKFIDSIKDEYRILEVKDSLLYKKDPEAYEATKQKEHQESQKELFDKLIDQLNDQKKRREASLLAYNNDLIKLLKDYIEDSIEYEKRDFNFENDLEKIVGNLIDPETWIKIDDKPYICRIEICSLEQDRMNVFLTDNNNYSYTATLRFDKTVLITENVVRINEKPKTTPDYEILIQLFDICDCELSEEWEFKTETERFEYVIDHLVPIFKANKVKKEAELLEKYNKENIDIKNVVDDDSFGLEGLIEGKCENNGQEDEDMDVHEKIEKLVSQGILKELEIDNLEEHNKQFENDNEDDEDYDGDGNSINRNNYTPDKYYFSVFVPEMVDELEPPIIALTSVEFFDTHHYLDDSLGSHNIGKNVKNALNRAGIYGNSELAEAMWEVVDITRTEKDIVDSMVKEGFIYNPSITN